ncbi:hypothetical protein BDV26DRAFT_292379 [Aspergillus bertholletiae]|uniref:Ecp2 effector protein domain-containing protein n=1 Tax=Aspergillus bertholletiae TaxID=1226010 RepID=A0A5N7B965_9EURO|nr:hypothetical protein BDV26DRAFT_292379 [Aspergillus bertholletiae]
MKFTTVFALLPFVYQVTIKARGTIEEVRDQLLSINSKWDEDYVEPAKAKRSTDFTKRTDFEHDGRVKCGGPWPQTDSSRIMRGIMYLQGVKGNSSNGPGPGNCGRVSCDWGSVIWWFNDDDKTKTLESYSSIADGALAIMGDCEYNKPGYKNWVSGQAFHNTNWNVIVRDEDDC